MNKTVPCPICKKPVAIPSENVPFCSDRCRTIDLGKWASGEYKISTPIFDPDELESLQNEQSRNEQQFDPGKGWKN
jgi:endogenous inhibitor of DNA gyrase (YacG/DUF329 family)